MPHDPHAAARYDLAFEEWSEKGAAQEQYDSDLSDGIVPCARFTADGVGVDPQSFDEWLNSNRADEMFEHWFENESDHRNQWDTHPGV